MSESGTPEAILSERDLLIALGVVEFTEQRDRRDEATAAVHESHEALRLLVERLAAERDEARQQLRGYVHTRTVLAAAEARLAELEAALRAQNAWVRDFPVNGSPAATRWWYDGRSARDAARALLVPEKKDEG